MSAPLLASTRPGATSLAAATRRAGGPFALMGGLTLVAAAIHGAAGEDASARYWALVTPLALVYLVGRARRRSESQWTTVIVLALLTLTFGAGSAFGSITAADSALGGGVAVLGLIVRLPVLLATGAGMTVSAVILSGVDAPAAWTACSTAIWLLATGFVLGYHERWRTSTHL